MYNNKSPKNYSREKMFPGHKVKMKDSGHPSNLDEDFSFLENSITL